MTPPPDADACQFLTAVLLAAPAMDAETAIRVASRALHLLCAMILGGGIFYLRTVLAHAGPTASFGDRRQVWARWVAVASTILLATGLYNYIKIIRDAKAPGAEALPSAYHMIFGIKFLLAILVMFIAALIAGKSPAAVKAQANMPRWLNIAWNSVIAIVVLGAVLRMMH